MLRVAGDAIRQCSDRETTLPEARVLADADNLDDVGVLYVLRQFRQHQADGRSLEQLITSWSRQQEYRYWDARLNDGFHFERDARAGRSVASAAVEQFMSALGRDHAGLDVQAATRAVAAIAAV